MNRPSTTAVRFVTIAASALLLAACGAAASAPGGADSPASASGAAAGSPGDSGQAGSPGLARHRVGSRGFATGKPHHRRPTRIARMP
jgi:hypothetical protein